MKKKILLNFDLEEFVIPIEQAISYDKERLFEISKQGLLRIMGVLNQAQIKSTFFTTLEFAKKYPGLMKQLITTKHELALHGCTHQDDYQNKTEDETILYLKKAKEELENQFSIKILGFRGPQFKHPPYPVLSNIGIKYDSSFHPTYIPGHYNNFFGSRHIKLWGNLKRIPVSVTPFLRLPFSWIWFKNLGLNYAKLCTTLNFLDSSYTNIFFHPWEFINLKEFKFKNQFASLSIRNSGDKLIKLLQNYIDWAKKRNYEFETIGGFLNLT